MLLMSHRPVALRCSQPFFSAQPEPAADETPHDWSLSMWAMSDVMYARDASFSGPVPVFDTEPVPNTAPSRRIWSLAVVCVSPHRNPAPPLVEVSPSRLLAASRPGARPISRHRALAESLSLCLIIASARARSWA